MYTNDSARANKSIFGVTLKPIGCSLYPEYRTPVARDLEIVTSASRHLQCDNHDISPCLPLMPAGPRLDLVPATVLLKIASSLNHADYSNLRATGRRFREVLPSIQHIRSNFYKVTGAQREQFRSRITRALVEVLKKNPDAAHALRTARVNHPEIASTCEGIATHYKVSFSFEYIGGSFIICSKKGPSPMEQFRHGLEEVPSQRSVKRSKCLDIERQRWEWNSTLSLFINMEKPKESLSSICSSANRVWIENDPSLEILLLAAMVSKFRELSSELGINEEEMLSLADSCPVLFEVGHQIQEEYGQITGHLQHSALGFATGSMT